MTITISGKDFKLTPAIKQYVTEKFTKLGKFNPDVTRIGVELDVDHNVTKGKKFRVEVWVYLPSKTIEAGLKAEHMEEAIDLVPVAASSPPAITASSRARRMTRTSATVTSSRPSMPSRTPWRMRPSAGSLFRIQSVT